MQEQLECGTTFLFPKLHFYGHYLFWRECLNLVFQDKYAKSKNSKKVVNISLLRSNVIHYANCKTNRSKNNFASMWKVKIPTLAVRFQILQVNIYILFLHEFDSRFLAALFLS